MFHGGDYNTLWWLPMWERVICNVEAIMHKIAKFGWFSCRFGLLDVEELLHIRLLLVIMVTLGFGCTWSCLKEVVARCCGGEALVEGKLRCRVCMHM